MCRVVLRGGGTSVQNILWQKVTNTNPKRHLRNRLHMNWNFKKNKETSKKKISVISLFSLHILGEKASKNKKWNSN